MMHGGKAMTEEGESKLARKLGLVPVTLMGMGIIIGVGIYVIIGASAGMAGNAVWLSFVLSALAAVFSGLSYSRLGQLRPKNAPEYQYASLAFGPFHGFLAEWLMLTAMVISSAPVALGFAGYLQNIIGVPIIVGAEGLIALGGIISWIGISQSAAIAGALTIVQSLGLIFVIVLGAPYVGQNNLIEMPAGFLGVLAGASLIFFAYLGFEGIPNYAEEMKNPVRDLPRAILLAIAITTVLYVLTAIAAVSAVGWQRLSGSAAPLAVVVNQVLGSGAGIAFSYLAAVATANTTMVLQLNNSRALWKLGDTGIFPRFLGRVDPKRRTPWVSVVAVTLITGLFALVGNVGKLAGYTNFTMLLSFIWVNAAALKVFGKKRQPDEAVKAGLPWIVPVLGILTSAILAVTAGWQAAVFGAIFLVSGAIVYWLMGLFSGGKTE